MSTLSSEGAEMGCTSSFATNSPFTSTTPHNNNRIDITEVEDEHFGHQLKDKKRGIIRLGFLNINSLSPHKNTAKYDSIKCGIESAELDIIGLCELNKCWHLLQPDDSWNEISKSWWRDSHRVTAYNTRDINSHVYQPGGTSISAINQIAHRTMQSGVDEHRLGRWSCLTLRGKNNIKTTIFSMY